MCDFTMKLLGERVGESKTIETCEDGWRLEEYIVTCFASFSGEKEVPGASTKWSRVDVGSY